MNLSMAGPPITTVDQRQAGLRGPRSDSLGLPPALGAQVEPGILLRAQSDGQGRSVGLQLVLVGCADQGEDLERLAEHPGQGQLGHGDALLRSELVEAVEALEVDLVRISGGGRAIEQRLALRPVLTAEAPAEQAARRARIG